MKNPHNLFVHKRRLHNGTRGVVGLYTNMEGKKVVIKRVSADQNFLLLKRETYALVSMSHDNLIHMWGKECFIDTSNYVWIPMEYMNGASLSDMIRFMRENQELQLKFDELQMGWIVSNVCKGLNYLHKLNRIHRDVTSSNILLSKDGRQVKIADFGFVLQIQEEEKRRSTCGTYEWMAPEVLTNKAYSYAADIWSLGIVIYECSELQTPYYGMTELKIHKQLKKSAPKMPKQNWSKDLLNFFTQCMHISAKKRATIAQLMAHPWMTSITTDPVLFNSDQFWHDLTKIISTAKADVKRRMAPYSPRKK